jgi:hypothetical protein
MLTVGVCKSDEGVCTYANSPVANFPLPFTSGEEVRSLHAADAMALISQCPALETFLLTASASQSLRAPFPTAVSITSSGHPLDLPTNAETADQATLATIVTTPPPELLLPAVLTCLDMSRTHFDSVGAAAAIACFKQLKVLKLCGCKQLESLSINGKSEGMALTHLELTRSASLVHLCLQCPLLRHLDLSGCIGLRPMVPPIVHAIVAVEADEYISGGSSSGGGSAQTVGSADYSSSSTRVRSISRPTPHSLPLLNTFIARHCAAHVLADVVAAAGEWAPSAVV